jgi:hypothetical protein
VPAARSAAGAVAVGPLMVGTFCGAVALATSLL